MAATRQVLTLEEFLERPEEKPALEYFEGKVSPKGSGTGQHSALQCDTTAIIDRLIRPRKVARAFPELRATFTGASLVPDVAVYRWERIPRTPAGKVANDFLEPPDIAVEIIAPGQSVAGLRRRCRWYSDHGVPAALLIHPERELVLLFRPGQEPITLTGDDTIDLTDVIPGVRMTVTQLFRALDMD